MIKHLEISKIELIRKIKSGNIKYGGNHKLKIYGTLKCNSGKRMKTENRIFFTSEEEAIQAGFRPCSHCLKIKFINWKKNQMSLFYNYSQEQNPELKSSFGSQLSNTKMFSKSQNILPYDGEVYYLGQILDQHTANTYYNYLLHNLDWVSDSAVIFGKKIFTKRKIAWFGDGGESFSYSSTIRFANNWNRVLLELKKLVEDVSGFQFNSCLLNLYHDGNEGMTWHSDKTKEFSKQTTIATLSLGAERRFDFKHLKSNNKRPILLENGSLLIMTGSTQTHWLHQVPKSKKITDPRISLTFRQFLKR